MKKRTCSFIFVFLMSIFLSGCTTKLSDKKSTFDAKGIDYEFQLPSTWKKTDDFKQVYNQAAVFGAVDSKSNSTMFVTGERKDQVVLKNFGERMRKEVAKLYGYKKTEDVYMKEFELNGKKAYKYTVKTIFEKRTVWLHLYYVETKSGMIRFDFYSIDDGDYEKRAKIIDQSVRSLKETSDKGETDTVGEEDTITFENDAIALKIVGIMHLKGDNDTKLLALRYSVTNKSDQSISANQWDSLVRLTQQETDLSGAELPKENAMLDLPKLLAQKDVTLSKGETVESVSLYTLKDTSNVELIPSDKEFPNTKPIQLTVPNK